jgi:hypothetical protein
VASTATAWRVLDSDLAVMLADGGVAIGDLAVLKHGSVESCRVAVYRRQA